MLLAFENALEEGNDRSRSPAGMTTRKATAEQKRSPMG
jgi:hypothetical protein